MSTFSGRFLLVHPKGDISFGIRANKGIMNRPTESQANSRRVIPLLSISPMLGDHVALRDILNRFDRRRWLVKTALTLDAALPLLQECTLPAVLCEKELGSLTWKDALAKLATLPVPPLLIVTSQLADDYLWAEALNLGAFDVLAKPFAGEELVRALRTAYLRWQDIHPNRRAFAA